LGIGLDVGLGAVTAPFFEDVHGIASHAIGPPDFMPVGQLAFLRAHYRTRRKPDGQENDSQHYPNYFHELASNRMYGSSLPE
jgi:hypothetical protein